MTEADDRPHILPPIIPVFPLAGAIVLPGGQLPLNVFEPRYLRMVDDVLGGARVIGMIQPRDDARAPELYTVGCAGRLTSFAETGDGRYLITLTGVSRFRIREEVDATTPYRQAAVDYSVYAEDADPDDTAQDVDRDSLFEAMMHYLDAEGISTDWDAAQEAPSDALVNSLAMGCPFAPNEKQALLEARNASERAQCLMTLMRMTGGDGASDGRILQ
ncbi:MAG: LON peptidase substrate-binding domain-containing protein [Parvularculaceae bacterium]|nr:LON peptidase substrate-binding domain-containing protein [Parvularculaceae bacterium]